MSSSRFMFAFITFMVSIIGMYIFYVTFGPAMDQMGIQFSTILPELALPSAWNDLAVTVLSYWTIFYNSAVVIVIAMGIWVVRVAIIDVDYQTPH